MLNFFRTSFSVFFLLSSTFLLSIKIFQPIHYACVLILIISGPFIFYHLRLIKVHSALVWMNLSALFYVVHSVYYGMFGTTVLFYVSHVLVLNNLMIMGGGEFYKRSISAACFVGLLLILSSWMYIGINGVPVGRFSFIFTNSNTFSLLLTLFCCLSLSWFVSKEGNNRRQKLVYLSIISVIVLSSLYFSMLSGSRKAILACVPIFSLFFFTCYRKYSTHKKSLFAKYLAIFALLYALYYCINWFVFSPYANRFMLLFELFDNRGSTVGSLNERVELINSAFDFCSLNPILGVGFDGFREYSGFGKYSHNNYLELLANTGIIGFILHYSFIFYLVVAVLKKIINNKGTSRLVALTFLNALIVILFFDISIVTYNSPVILFLLCIISSFLNEGKHEKNLLLNAAHE